MHYILDSSVIVKWFNKKIEDDVEKALKLMDLYRDNKIELTIPDLAVYEVSNALRYNKNFHDSEVKEIISILLDMDFNIISANSEVISLAIEIAYEDNITVYDSIFLSLSSSMMIPLISANPKHHKLLKQRNIILLKDVKV
ncbi:MAG: type II toxin-antitoxin system VapC family toxin [Actinobacteria bacterium]|nr:type II toxin-antitoxin system VapC family toxin [Actinomycetota bacterium]